MLILSSGFDAHEADPLASIYLTDEDYAWVTEGALQLASELCNGRVVRCVSVNPISCFCVEVCLSNSRAMDVVEQVSVLEGGYNVPTLARCVTAHVRQLAAYGS